MWWSCRWCRSRRRSGSGSARRAGTAGRPPAWRRTAARRSSGGCASGSPGAALTSQIAPPVSRTGSAMSGEMKSMPATSSPTTRAASSAISTLSGCASKVRSMEMPPVDMLPVSVELDHRARGRARRPCSKPCSRTSSTAASSTLMRVSTFSWPTPRRGSALVSSTSSRDGAAAVADDVRRHPLGERDHPAADDQHPVVLAGDERSRRRTVAAAGLVLGDRERGADLVLVLQVEHDAAAVVAVERLAARPGSRSGRPPARRRSTVRTDSDVRHRQPGRREQPGRQLLVAGDVDRERRRVATSWWPGSAAGGPPGRAAPGSTR